MVKSWKECKTEAGADQLGPPPSINHCWYAYKGGTAYGPFPTELIARRNGNLVEKLVDIESKKIFDEYWSKVRVIDAKAFNIWHESLREEYIDMQQSIFDVIYSKAYEDGHSYGHDEVVSRFSDLAYFVEEILRAQNGTK